MKRLFNWQVTLGLALLALSAGVYYVHFIIFRDAHHIFIYFLGDVAFVFFEVLLVTLVIHRLLYHRERKARDDKLDMLTGAFFSEIGTRLLGSFAALDPGSRSLIQSLTVPTDWSEREFLDIRDALTGHVQNGGNSVEALKSVKDDLRKKREFLLDLLQNPGLLGDEPFTELVWMVYHLAEELVHREDLHDLTADEKELLLSDAKHVYRLLVEHWMDHMKRLKAHRPYLFALTKRKVLSSRHSTTGA